jgi:tRNA(Ser,Leu) C12 N-acetylase TAN1
MKCPKCKRGDLELFGVTERGQYKYACDRCYHHIECEKLEDVTLVHRVYTFERAVEETPSKLDNLLKQLQNLRNQRVTDIFNSIRRRLL